MSNGFFILQGKRVIPATRSQWVEMYSSDTRQIATTKLSPDVRVSTVFIGDGFTMFETIIFGGIHDQDADWVIRSDYWDDAVEGHIRTVEKLLQEQSCVWLDMLNVGADMYVNDILRESEITTADMYNDTSPESIRLKKAFAEWSLATFASNNEKEEH